MLTNSSIILQSNGLEHLQENLPLLNSYSQFVVISHSKLNELYGKTLLAHLKKFKKPIIEFFIPEGEESKNLKYAAACWKKMLSQGVDRQAAVIALGGGVVCDLAGFIASCYMRGIDLFYLPTTLLAMVDAAIGGKTGINFNQYKNAIGTFYTPRQILIDPHCLSTLPTREFNSGLAEIIKYGIISDLLLFEKLESDVEKLHQRQGSLIEEVIRNCIHIKNTIVNQDWKDKADKRAILNYGHTFGHAIETVTHYRHYLHGEAVAIGMSCAAELSAELGLCHLSVVERQNRLCLKANLPMDLVSLPIESLIMAMQSDKKAVCGKISLILVEEIGKVIKVDDVDPLLIQRVLLRKMSSSLTLPKHCH